MCNIINSTIPNNKVHVERIFLTCPGYEKTVLEYILIALKQANTTMVRHSFGDSWIDVTFKEKPSNIEEIVSDVLTLDKLQRIKLDKE